jgi:hypothetical protein
MLNDFEIIVTGGFAIVTIMMWVSFLLLSLYYIYKSRLLKPLRKFIDSLIVLIKPRKQRYQYNNLYVAGYIYRWSFELCLIKWNRGL